MKRLLLSTLLCCTGLSCLTAMAEAAFPNEVARINNARKDHLTIDEKIANPCEIISSPAMKRSTMKTGAADDNITLTVQWAYSDDPDWYDHVPLFVLIDENKDYYTLSEDELKRIPSRQFELSLPKGKYYGVMIFTTKTPDCNDHLKLVFMDETDLSESSTVMFDGKTATHRISQEYILPDGSSPNIVDLTGDATYEGGNCTGDAMCMVRFLEIPEISWGICSYLQAEMEGLLGANRIKCNDFFVSAPSDKFDIYTTMFLQPVDLEKQEISKNIPFVLSSRAVPITDIDKTYTQTLDDLVLFTPPTFVTSKAGGIPFPDITCEYHYRNMDLAGAWSYSTGFGSYQPDGSIYTDLDDNAPVLIDICSNENDFWDYSCIFESTGIISPKFLIRKDGSADYIMHDNIYTRMGYDEIMRVNYYLGDEFNGHKFFSFNSAEDIPVFGNSAPILSMPIMQSVPGNGAFLAPNWGCTATWVGNFGERRSIDNFNMNFVAKAGDEVILDDFTMFPWPISNHSSAEHEAHEISLIFDNCNFEIDGIPGNTHVEMKYMERAEGDMTCPSLQMMQFRNAEGRISNRFDKAEGATINISYGDFYFRYENDRAFYVEDCNLKVEVAPYGTDDFVEIATEENPEYFKMPCWGYFRSGNLSGLGKSPNGWWNVRLSLEDENGNSNTQVVSPAFYAADTHQTGIDAAVDNSRTNAIYYTPQGLRVANPTEGLYIKVAGGKATKVIL